MNDLQKEPVSGSHSGKKKGRIKKTRQEKAEEIYKSRMEKEIEERTYELNESRNFISHIMDTSPDILFVIDLKEEDIVYISNSIVTSLGFHPEAFNKRKKEVFRNIIHDEDYRRMITHIVNLQSLQPGEVREIEFRIRDKKEKYHWMNVRYTIFKNYPDGSLHQVLGIAQDISVKKEAEAAVKTERMRNDELRRLNELMDTFVHAAAHDLKAPISNLIQLTDFIENTSDSNLKLQLQERYKPIIKILNRTISGLINVLSIELEASKCIRELSFAEVYEGMRKELDEEFSAVKPGVILKFSACPSIVYVESFMTSIFRNLLSNALKYKSPDRNLKIEISTEFSGEYVLLSFKDNGIGIDLNRYRDDLFKPFKRYTTRSEGSGLGLHLVKSIVSKNGGKIEIESQKGTGSIFKISLIQYAR